MNCVCWKRNFLAQNHWFIQTISKRCRLHWVEYNYQTISIVFRRLKLCPEITKHFKLLHWVIVDDLFVNLNLLATLFKLICEYLKHLLTWSHYFLFSSLFRLCFFFFVFRAKFFWTFIVCVVTRRATLKVSNFRR